MDHQVLALLFASVGHIQSVMIVNDYLAYVTGGPLFGDLLQTWPEYGAVLAACLVRKPAAGTLALTVNGLIQVFLYGTHDPHLLYGFSGLGADVVFASFRYKRYDGSVVILAGIFCGLFWYPIVWFTHGIYLYPVVFILPDLTFRILGSAVGDGLVGGAAALVILRLVGRRWKGPQAPAVFSSHGPDTRGANAIGLLIAILGVLVIALTAAFPQVSSLFLSVGPNIPSGIETSEEYNPGYVIGLLLIFLVSVMLAFGNLGSRYFSDWKEEGTHSPPSQGP